MAKKVKKKPGKKSNRLVLSIILGILLGFVCVFGRSIDEARGFEPIVSNYLMILYNRISIGFMIGILEPFTLVKDKTKNSIYRGGLIGLVLGAGILFNIQLRGAILLWITGIVAGIVNDFIVTKYAE